MSLPQNWVDRIFTKMAVRYGSAWIRQWEGVDPELVKADWAEQLSYYQQQPSALSYALDNLPVEKPPTVAQFRELCRRAPEPVRPQLPVNFAGKARIDAVMREMAQQQRGTAPLQWAYDLQEQEKAGKTLTQGQRDAWREALAHGPSESDVMGAFTPPERDALPPAMRGEA